MIPIKTLPTLKWTPSLQGEPLVWLSSPHSKVNPKDTSHSKLNPFTPRWTPWFDLAFLTLRWTLKTLPTLKWTSSLQGEPLVWLSPPIPRWTLQALPTLKWTLSLQGERFPWQASLTPSARRELCKRRNGFCQELPLKEDGLIKGVEITLTLWELDANRTWIPHCRRQQPNQFYR